MCWYFLYGKAILGLKDVKCIDFIPTLHSNQSFLSKFVSRMRQPGKDQTNLYAGGVLQQNVMYDIHGNQKKGK